eukprot:1138840-Pelagomonas_calceolata.AAC.4
MPEDSGFLLGPQEQTNSASQEGTASQGLLLPSILGLTVREAAPKDAIGPCARAHTYTCTQPFLFVKR